MIKLMIAAALCLAALTQSAAQVAFRAAEKNVKIGADSKFAAFEAVVGIGGADSVVMTVNGPDGKILSTVSRKVSTGRNALALHVEALPPGTYDVVFRAYARGIRTAIATNSFVKTSPARKLPEGVKYVFTDDGSRAEMAPGKIRAADLTPLRRVTVPKGAPLVVAADGAARMAIVATEAHAPARWLAETIRRMTGVEVPVYALKTNDLFKAGPAIYVGYTRATREAGFARPGTPDKKWGVGAHAFRCVTKDGDVHLFGAGPVASGYAVYDFAERVLGVRQYYWTNKGKTPAEMLDSRTIGEDVVETDGLALPRFDWSDLPVYEFRTEFGAGHHGWKYGDAHQSAHTVHAPCYWNTDPNLNLNGRWSSYKDVFQMDENGTRGRTPMLCYGNPRTLEVYKRHIKLTIEGKRAGFAGDPVNVPRKTVTVSQWDAGVACFCQKCKKLSRPDMAPTGDASPILWGYFTKELAKWMKKNYPDWRISILPYINTCEVPPGVDFVEEGNVDAYVCTMPGLALFAQDKCRKEESALIRRWAKCTGNPVQNWHYICWPADRTSAPYVFGSAAVRFYRDMKDAVCGSFLNGGYPVDRLGLSAYVWVRAMWNPALDSKAVYDEFARRMFGPAAKQMRKVIAMQEAGWERQWQRPSVASKNIFDISYPRKEVEEMERLVEESKKLVKGSGLYERRLAYYAKPFEKFFRESWEHANNKAFAPLMMRKVAAGPKLDGVLDDACWKLAEPLLLKNEPGSAGNGSTNTVACYPTYVRAVWTQDGVALGIDCTDKTPGKIITSSPPGLWWGNDCLEILIDFTGENEGQWGKLWIDAKNQLRFFSNKGMKWKPAGIKSGAKIVKTGWSAEIFIPYTDIAAFEGAKHPVTQGGMKWTGNVCRLRIADAWSKTGKTPGSVWELQRLNSRRSVWNNDVNAFGDWKFVEQ